MDDSSIDECKWLLVSARNEFGREYISQSAKLIINENESERLTTNIEYAMVFEKLHEAIEFTIELNKIDMENGCDVGTLLQMPYIPIPYPESICNMLEKRACARFEEERKGEIHGDLEF